MQELITAISPQDIFIFVIAVALGAWGVYSGDQALKSLKEDFAKEDQAKI